jgi:hypothetical protein
MKWLNEFLSGDSDKSSKRLVFLLVTAVFIIQHFLLMYIKIEIANAKLVESSQDSLFWIIMTTGTLIAGEPAFNKFGIGKSKSDEKVSNGQ